MTRRDKIVVISIFAVLTIPFAMLYGGPTGWLALLGESATALAIYYSSPPFRP